MSNGLLVTFEGQDGCGKSTVIDRLAPRLASRGYLVETLPEFSTSPFGDYLRQSLVRDKFLRDNSTKPSALTQACAIVSDLVYFSEHEIAPRLNRGSVILKDRFVESAIVCQLPIIMDEYGQTETSTLAREWMELLLQLVPTKPDLTFYLDVPLSERARRIQSRVRTIVERDANNISDDDLRVFGQRDALYRSLFFGEHPRGIVVDNDRDITNTVLEIEETIRLKLLNRAQKPPPCKD